jgi:hypothetical protein
MELGRGLAVYNVPDPGSPAEYGPVLDGKPGYLALVKAENEYVRTYRAKTAVLHGVTE